MTAADLACLVGHGGKTDDVLVPARRTGTRRWAGYAAAGGGWTRGGPLAGREAVGLTLQSVRRATGIGNVQKTMC